MTDKPVSRRASVSELRKAALNAARNITGPTSMHPKAADLLELGNAIDALADRLEEAEYDAGLLRAELRQARAKAERLEREADQIADLTRTIETLRWELQEAKREHLCDCH